MLKLLWRYYGWIGTAKTIYNRVLKPVYLELKKDADELERQEQKKKNKKKNKKQTRSKDVINKNLNVAINGKQILKDFNLEIGNNEVHAIMGPNGTGKSTLAAALSGREEYEILSGEVTYKGKDLLAMSPDERAREGVFLAFQYPVEIPGVSVTNFMKAAVNAKRKHFGMDPMDAKDFLKLMKEKMEFVEIKKEMMSRSLNEGFSGGEKKRNEVFQMAMLEPSLCILDETDSGLDIDALRIVANGVNKLRNADRSFLVITHYQRLLNYIVPDHVHVMYGGKIVKSGGKELALQLEEKGYDWIKEEVGETV